MNDIRILPLYFYPFNRTQNQVMNSSLFEQDIIGNSGDNSINYQFNYRLGKAMPYNDGYVLSQSPSILGNTPLGEMTFDINLSQDSFSTLFGLDSVIKDKTLYDIKMLVFFKDYNNVSNGINKYFYYVEQVKRVNANNFTFTLSLDVFKTYYNDVMEIKGLRPERYFIPANKVLDSLTTIEDDIVLPYSNEVQTLLGTLSYWSEYKGGTTVSYGREVWDYYYLKKEDNSIIVLCYLYSMNGYLVNEHVDSNDIDKIKSNPSFIKSVRSCVPPNTEYFEVNDNINQYIQADLHVLGKYISYMCAGEFRLNDSTRVLKVGTINEMIPNLNLIGVGNLSSVVVIESFYRYNKDDNSTYLYDSSEEMIGVPEVDFNSYKNDNVSIVKPMISIGFEGENKVVIPLFKGDFNEYGDYSIKIRLEHSLFQTKEVIYFSKSKSELEITRVNEFVNPRLTDAYETYILNNKNTLIQKEKELNKFATRDTIVRGITSVGIAGLGIAGAMFTGGGSIAVAGGIIAGGMSGYNMIDGLGKNARARAMHQAELDDKRGKIENFTPSNYNENMSVSRYAPILTTYSKLNNTINYTNEIYNDMKINPLNYYNYDVMRMYGLKYGGFNKYSVNEMMTRKHYNYIEVNDVMNATQNGNIPSNLYTHILDVLQNGITFSTIDYILNNEIKNEEV